MAGILKHSAVGDAFGLTKQAVSRIVRRWKRPDEGTQKNVPNAAQSPKPAVGPSNSLSEADIIDDIERVIAMAVRPYADESNPMLHFDELKAECRAKLAKILHYGCLTKCPTRAKVFAFLKTSFRNHVRSLVQKYAFAAKRTGKPTQDSRGAESVELTPRKPCHVSLSEPDNAIQLGTEDDSFRRREFLEAVRDILTEEEDEVLDYLLNEPFCASGGIVDTGPSHPSNKRFPAGFLRARASIRRKCRAILVNGIGVSWNAEGHEESLGPRDLCTVAGTQYGDTKRHKGTEISPEVRGRPTRLQQPADDNAPASPGSPHRSRCGSYVVQGVRGSDPSGRAGSGGRAFDGGGSATEEQNLATQTAFLIETP
jgi:hypothetical protein